MAKSNGARSARRTTGDNIVLVAQERTLHLVDLENLLGDPWATGPRVGWALEQYFEVAGWRTGDLVYVAANPHLVKEFCFDPPVGWSLHAARGPDGADIALLAHAAPEFVARRAGRMVVGSGDHIFAERAQRVADSGVAVLVVARPESRSWQLAQFPFRPFAPAAPGGGAAESAVSRADSGGALAA